MYALREANSSDVGAIMALARQLNTINLPPDEEFISRLLAMSECSFAGGDDPDAFDPARVFVFVLEGPEGEIVGTSAVHAQHGTPEAPHVFFRVTEEERFAALEPAVPGDEPMPRHMRHRVLQLGQTFEGPSEVGGLILDPKVRQHPDKLGRLLSIGRFCYVAGRRHWFRDRMLAELLPPLSQDEQGQLQSPLWDALGRRFTGLDYAEADQLSRRDKRFIHRLFPRARLYASLLSNEAQAVIGAVGPKTIGAQRLLERVGFSDSGKIDPFDGGPHFEASTDDLQPVRESRRVRLDARVPPPDAAMHYIARFSSKAPHFVAVKAPLAWRPRSSSSAATPGPDADPGGAGVTDIVHVGPAVLERLALDPAEQAEHAQLADHAEILVCPVQARLGAI